MKKKTRTSDKYRSEAMAALHEAARDLHGAGGIDKLTMRQFDLLCLCSAPIWRTVQCR